METRLFGEVHLATRGLFFKGVSLVLSLLLLASTSCVSKAAFEELQTQLSQNQQHLANQNAAVVRLTKE